MIRGAQVGIALAPLVAWIDGLCKVLTDTRPLLDNGLLATHAADQLIDALLVTFTSVFVIQLVGSENAKGMPPWFRRPLVFCGLVALLSFTVSVVAATIGYRDLITPCLQTLFAHCAVTEQR